MAYKEMASNYTKLQVHDDEDELKMNRFIFVYSNEMNSFWWWDVSDVDV
jgi:hypothetical protein